MLKSKGDDKNDFNWGNLKQALHEAEDISLEGVDSTANEEIERTNPSASIIQMMRLYSR